MLAQFSYCPTLHSRVAEIKALAQLPAASKDRLFPLIVGRPWPNAKHLDRTWEKVRDALKGRRFALDLDHSKFGSATAKPASTEFDALFSRKNGFDAYYSVIEEIPESIPVLRVQDGEILLIKKQSSHIERIDRGIVARLEFGKIDRPLYTTEMILDTFDDVSFFIDTGWSRDLLPREGWASSIVERIARDRPNTEIVITGSSFPDSFTGMGGRGIIPVRERVLYNNLVRRHNAAALIYGDWGSTRPPSLDQGPMRNIPRIDLPMPGQWISFRRDRDLDDEEDYRQIAQRVVSDTDWPNGMDIWGTYLIEWTAGGEPNSIRSPASAAAARINIHLHRQSFFGENDALVDGDEPFTDD